MQQPPFVIEAASIRSFEADHCANCLEPLAEDVETLFCSSWCAEIAEAVRYQRRVFRDGRIDDPDVQAAVGIRNAFLLAGGYRALGRTLSVATRIQVKHRDGKCRVCGKPGTEIDHITGSSPDLDNLQLLCTNCHHDKTAQNLVPASPEQQAQLMALYITRVLPDNPTLLADDEVEWQIAWRSLKKSRKQRFLDSLREAGIEIHGLTTRAEMIDARDNWVAPEPNPLDRIADEYEGPDWGWKMNSR